MIRTIVLFVIVADAVIASMSLAKGSIFPLIVFIIDSRLLFFFSGIVATYIDNIPPDVAPPSYILEQLFFLFIAVATAISEITLLTGVTLSS